MRDSPREYNYRRSFFYLLLFSLAVSILSGTVSGWYFSRSGGKEIVVLDIGKILEEKRKEFVQKYRDRELSQKMKEEMEKEISLFVESLNRIVEEESMGKIVLTKDSVVSNIKDITDEVYYKVKNSY